MHTCYVEHFLSQKKVQEERVDPSQQLEAYSVCGIDKDFIVGRSSATSPTQLSLARPVILTKLRSTFCCYLFTVSIIGEGGEACWV